MAVTSFAVIFLGNILFMRVFDRIEFPFARDNSLFVLVEALAVFTFFKNLHFHSDAVNRTAKYVFPIYLYHSAVLAGILPSLTEEYLITTSGGSIWIMGLLILVTVLLSALISMGIEWLRRGLFSSAEERLITFLERKGNELYQCLYIKALAHDKN